MALFRIKFVCILAISNLVFRWVSCKVVCERVWRNVQNCAVKQGLVAGSCEWLAACKPPEDVHEWSMQRSWTVMPAVALQDKKSSLTIQLVRGLDSRLSQVVSPLCYEKMTLRIPFSLQYEYLLYLRNVESFLREFWERNPREKQDWLIPNLYIVTFWISQLSPSPLLHLWEVH